MMLEFYPNNLVLNTNRSISSAEIDLFMLQNTFRETIKSKIQAALILLLPAIALS